MTIGFAATPERFDWHTHMDMYGAMSPDEKLKMVVELIENILSGKEKIIHSSVLGYFLTDNIDNIRRYQEKDEIIRILEWGDL